MGTDAKNINEEVIDALYEASHLYMGQSYTNNDLYTTASRLCNVPYSMVKWVGEKQVGDRHPDDYYKSPRPKYQER